MASLRVKGCPLAAAWRIMAEVMAFPEISQLDLDCFVKARASSS